MKKIGKTCIKLCKLISLPVLVYLFFFLLCKFKGVEGFGVGGNLTVILRNTIQTGLIALAVSYNLTSGRFDFSVGATLVLSTIMGGMLTLQFNLGPIAMLLLCLLFGAILGGLGGALYTILRIPPMVVSLGVAMIYEAIGFLISKGAGVKLLGKSNLMIWSKQPYIYILCIAILAVLILILNYTKFGYDNRALSTGQEIAVNIGIKEKKNAIICYIIAGALLAGSGVISISILGTMSPEMSLSSLSYIQNAFLPMFIGNMLAKHADRNTGVLIGALTQATITAAFGKLAIGSSWSNILNGLIVLAFFAYSFNSYRIEEHRRFKQKREMAEHYQS